MFEDFLTVTYAPEYPENFDWINTDKPLTTSKLKGHVIVLDFWTYCCINCMHTLPVIEELEEKYKDKPVVFIGVHSGKFPSEQETKNIEQAVARYEIKHPVIVDQKMKIWNTYGVRGWPTIIVIDPTGKIVYKQSGEGQKNSVDDTIQVLLENHSKKGTLTKEQTTIKNTKKPITSTLSFPGKIAISGDGKIAISDSNHNRIIITDMNGKMLYKIGNGSKGFADGTFDEAQFFRPQGVTWHGANLFVADTENHSLRFVDLDKGIVTTAAGTGNQGPWISFGGKGQDVSLTSPWDVCAKNKTVYIAMAGNHQIWRYDIRSGNVAPFAGTGQEGIIDGKTNEAQLAQPSGLSIDGNTLYLADSEVSSVRKINLETNELTTIVGLGLFEFGHKDGNNEGALFQHPLGLCVAGKFVFVADTYNSSIRMINLDKGETSTLITRTEDSKVCKPDDPSCDILPLYEPSDVKFYQNMLYIADTNNHLIRKFDLKTNKLETLDIS